LQLLLLVLLHVQLEQPILGRCSAADINILLLLLLRLVQGWLHKGLI
jgi:hypothetical protein